MTASDILHGRGGGRFLPWEPVAPPAATVVLVCDDGTFPALHRWRMTASGVGKPCFMCEAPLRRLNDVDEAIRRHEEKRASVYRRAPMTTPKRIQLRRTKSWRKPADAIVVARPSKWGNPFQVEPVGNRADPAYTVTGWTGWPMSRAAAHDVAVAMFREALLAGSLGFTVEDLSDLAGHDLACWCPLQLPCHADVLLELANSPERDASHG